MVNFDKLFLHQFSTKIHQTWRDGVKTSKKSKKINDFPNIFLKFYSTKIIQLFLRSSDSFVHISQIRDENQRRNNLSKLTTFHPIFQLPHSALMVTHRMMGIKKLDN